MKSMAQDDRGKPSSLVEAAIVQLCDQIARGRVPPIESPLPAHLSNNILDGLRKRDSLFSETLPFLSSQHFHLTKADLSECNCTYESLAVLRDHKLAAISLKNMKVPGEKFLNLRRALTQISTPDNRHLVKYLNVGGARPVHELLYLLWFLRLEVLVLSECRQLETTELDIISSNAAFKHTLRVLDISRTPVSYLSPLSEFKNLEVLSMHRVRVHDDRLAIVTVLESLKHLRVLDCSVQRTDYNTESGEHHSWTDVGLVILEEFSGRDTPVWPYLHSLDLAGSSLHGISVNGLVQSLTKFIRLHSNLGEVSILDTPLDMYPFSFPERPLTIYNAATKPQALAALSRYWHPERDAFTAHSLQAVYYLLQSSYDTFTDDDIRQSVMGVTSAMRCHQETLSIQMAGTACLYHLCKQRRVRRLQPFEVYLCVERCLDAAETYQNIIQLQKNVWLTLCSDYLLQCEHIDFQRTSAVALESMVKSREPSVCRMTIAIVSIVAPKVRSMDTKMLVASEHKYVSFFVKTINDHISNEGSRDNYSQFTLKFTLSALWNLTDECPKTCSLFLECGGLDAAFRALHFFRENASIQTKVLGLLNNLAEVEEVQKALLKPEFVSKVVAMLESGFDSEDSAEGTDRRMDMSYFAAGILSNLLVSSEWTFEPTPEMVNEELVNVISRWKVPKHTMVAYRSFTPFIALLNRFDLPGVQMWATWAIHHVIRGDKNRANCRNYANMIRNCELEDVLGQLLWDERTLEVTKVLVAEIVEMCQDKSMQSEDRDGDGELPPRVEAL